MEIDPSRRNTPPADPLDKATYDQTRKIYQHTGAILDYLSSPPDGSDDPLEQLHQVLLQIDRRLSRIEKRLGINSPSQD